MICSKVILIIVSAITQFMNGAVMHIPSSHQAMFLAGSGDLSRMWGGVGGCASELELVVYSVY